MNKPSAKPEIRKAFEFYIDGDWQWPVAPNPYPVFDPSTGRAFATVS